MIAFFRKIRIRLLGSGQTRKYLLYAMGEIALVVIGILIALQINNWNENRINDESVRRHLRSLSKAVEHDINELSISLEFNEFRYHSWQYLLKMSDIPVDSLPDIPRPETFIVNVWNRPYPDSVDNAFIQNSMQQLNNTFLGMQFNYSAIREINNLGIFSDIDNDTLKATINEYYYHLDWKFGEQFVNNRYKLAEDLKNYLRDQYAISCTYPPEPQRIFKVIHEDEKVAIMFKDVINRAHQHYWVTLELRALGEKLLEAIDRELNRNSTEIPGP